MDTYVNTDVHTRTWPTISREDGRTLSLAPGEEVELDSASVPASDPYLKRQPRRAFRPSSKSTGATTQEAPAEGAAPDKE
jgi:hypothetical protein